MAELRLIDEWIAAKADLGIDVSGPVEIELSNGVVIRADVLVRGFGLSEGTIGMEDDKAVLPHLNELAKAGYGVSYFGKPSRSLKYDREATIDCLRDWGWAGLPGHEPDWFRSAGR